MSDSLGKNQTTVTLNVKHKNTPNLDTAPGRFSAWPGRKLLCTTCLLALSVGPFSTPGVLTPSTAHAQSSVSTSEALTQELFLAIENQDLGGVKSAVQKGADVEARDFTGTQPVDLAISRGFFNIAHYLISVRNAKQAALSGTPVQPAPSPEELAQTQDETPNGSAELNELDDVLGEAPPPPAPAPVETVIEDPFAVTPTPEPAIDPFSTEQATSELPVLGEIQEPQAMPAEAVPFGDGLEGFDEPPKALSAENEPQSPPTPDVEVVDKAQDVLADTPTSKPFELNIQAEATLPADDFVETPDVEADLAPVEKASAFKRFFTTFGDFFKPPNITGVVHKKRETSNEGAVSDEEIQLQLKQLDEERGNEIIKGPAVPITPEELAKELPPIEGIANLTPEEIAALPHDGSSLPAYSVSSPSSSGAPLPANEDAFGDLTIDDEVDEPTPTPSSNAEEDNPFGAPEDDLYAGDELDIKEAPGVPGRAYNPSLPFGGGVDPLLLDFLGLSLVTGQELTGEEDETALREILLKDRPISFGEAQDAILAEDGNKGAQAAGDDNPFALLDDAKEPEISDLLEDLDGPNETAKADAPTSDATGSDNPFDLIEDSSTSGNEDVGELADLLAPNGEGEEGWDVKEVENADIPDEIFVLADLKATGEALDNVELTLGIDVGIGKELDKDRLRLMDQDTIRRPCLEKGGPNTLFCTDKINWPFELEEIFLVDTIMYQGTRAIARYEAGQSINYHTLFRTDAFEQVVGYYTERYGQPTTKIDRAIAPLAAPRQDNPTFIWQSREAGTDTIVNLEIRKFDDAKDEGFPDTKRGVIMLYRNHAKPIFPILSQLELMVLKTEGVETASSPSGDAEEGPPTENADPSSIWN
ncbi:ankyrin repeat domain-containing protein [Magnetovibrio sp. PR-2]|uniref:ankyrin repeat domain-containing protein n=1 Tax=Magnetovibrio sp. PR-2 TaxID=3120356 RepID=UPI002FCE48DA